MQDKDYFERVATAMNLVDREAIGTFINLLLECATLSKRVFIVGNGGSATTASHMAVDLGVGSRQFGLALPVVCLTDSSGILTAIANDRDFSQVFSEQLQLLGQPGDALICISVSGDSPNAVSAALQARNLDLVVVALTGFNGGRLAQIADVHIHVPTDQGDYGPAEDIHLMINHMVTEQLRARAQHTQHDAGHHE